MDETLIRQIKIFCPTHQSVFEIEEKPQIICEIREHALSNDFPRGEFWEYCCDCQTFFPSGLEVGEKAKEACPQCERPTIRRFACNECKVLTFDSGEDTKSKNFHLDSETFAVTPACPGCLKDLSGIKKHLHKCGEIEAVLSTPRETCPFCKKEIVKPKSAPAAILRCPKCNAKSEPDSYFCNTCGNQLRSNPDLTKRGTATAKTQLLGSICPTCGAGNQSSSTFCVSCGQALRAEESKHSNTLLPVLPVPQSTIPTQAVDTVGAVNVTPSAVKPGAGKGCLTAIGICIGIIFLCAVLQGIISNRNRSTDSYTTPSPTSLRSTPIYLATPYSANSTTNASSNTSLPTTFSRSYSGTIGNQSFSMSLERDGSELKGTASTRKTDHLDGTIDSDGSFTLKGYENGNKWTGNYSGRIYSDGSIVGTWTNTQGEQGVSFSLSED
jgi:ribosomal protein L40E